MAVLAHLGDQHPGLSAVGGRKGTHHSLGLQGCWRLPGLAEIDPLDRVGLGLVPVEDLFQGIADLAHRGLGPGGLHGKRQEVAGPGGTGGEGPKGAFHRSGVTLSLQAGQLLQLTMADGGIVDLEHRNLIGVSGAVAVDPHHRLAPGIDARLGAGAGLFDAALGQAVFDGLGHAAQGLDLGDVRPGAGGEVGGEPLDIIGPTPGIDHPGLAAFQLQEQLGVARDAGGEIRRQGQRLVQGIGVQALGLAASGCHGLDAGPGDVVVDILGRQAPAAGLGVGPQGQGSGVLGRELGLHELGPQQATSPLLGDLHEGVHARIPEEGEAGGKLVDAHACGHAGADIFDAVGQGIGQLQVQRRPGFLDVIAGDRDRVEPRHLGGSI